MLPDDDRAAAVALLDDFAGDTGLTTGRPGRRYLWTDAFAVCTWLGLHHTTGDERFLDLALRLVERVHGVLGRHRDDDPRKGWISGLGEEEGARHPTAGGLRIGKPLPERPPGAPFDRELEWERDGQYYHYLTKWMYALACAARATGQTRYHRWAAELADAAHRGFVHGPGSAPRLHWKMSVDLTRPLVASMGYHDALDGVAAVSALRASPARDPEAPSLEAAETALQRMCVGTSWVTDDPLGLGGLLTDALRLAQRVAEGRRDLRGLLTGVVEASVESLAAFAARSPLRLPAERRLAFRELGLVLGLRAAGRMIALAESVRLDPLSGLHEAIQSLSGAAALAEHLEAFWRTPESRATAPWTDHRDINVVSLAAALAPEGYLMG